MLVIILTSCQRQSVSTINKNQVKMSNPEQSKQISDPRGTASARLQDLVSAGGEALRDTVQNPRVRAIGREAVAGALGGVTKELGLQRVVGPEAIGGSVMRGLRVARTVATLALRVRSAPNPQATDATVDRSGGRALL